MARRARWATVAAAVLLVATFLYLVVVPQVLAFRLRSAIVQTGGPSALSVSVAPSPLVAMGRLSRVDLSARRAVLQGLPIDSLTLHVRGVTLDVPRLLVQAQLQVREIEGGEGEVILRQEDLQQVLAKAKGMRNPVVALDDGVVRIEGDIRVISFDLRARIEGRLVVASPQTVDLHVQSLNVSGLQVPAEVGNALIGALNPLLSLRGVPFAARVRGVTVDDGTVRLELSAP